MQRQTKKQDLKNESALLKEENAKLREENLNLVNAHKVICPVCISSTSQRAPTSKQCQLILENFHLNKKLQTMREHVTKLKSKAPVVDFMADMVNTPFLTPLEPTHLHQPVPVSGLVDQLLSTNTNMMTMIMDRVNEAVAEIMDMAKMDGPLWIYTEENTPIVLNQAVLQNGTGPRPTSLRAEFSMESKEVSISSIELVRILMDEKLWSSVFSGIVARATTLDHVLSTGDHESYHKTLLLMNAEYQMLSPFVRTRESCFLRYCHNNSNGTWIVADVSLDENWKPINSSFKCRRKPSGCLITDMSNGKTKVTWVEHVEVDNEEYPEVYKPFINSGLAFGAKRWISLLERHCQYLATTARTDEQPVVGFSNTVILCMGDRRGLLNLARRMVLSFDHGAISSHAQPWNTFSGINLPNMRFMVRNSLGDSGHPSGTILSVSAYLSIKLIHERVYTFLRNHQNRNKWDTLSHGCAVEELATIAVESEEWNYTSLLQVIPNEEQNKMVILQENHSDRTGSFITYAPVKYEAMNTVLVGGDPDEVELLPSGFAIYPDGQDDGSLVTVAFQLLLSSIPNAHVSNTLIIAVGDLILSTCNRIDSSLKSRYS